MKHSKTQGEEFKRLAQTAYYEKDLCGSYFLKEARKFFVKHATGTRSIIEEDGNCVVVICFDDDYCVKINHYIWVFIRGW